jgi:hypothetical protein
MSCEGSLDQFSGCWEGLADPRSGNAGLHDFYELLMIALCTVLCGGQGAVDMALFAKAKEPYLRGFLKLENGVPSHDTFSRAVSHPRSGPVPRFVSAVHDEVLRAVPGRGGHRWEGFTSFV